MELRRRSLRLLSRGAAAVTVGAAGTAAIGGRLASASGPSTPSSTTTTSPVTVTPSGWIKYNDISLPPMVSSSTVTVSGTLDANGNCHIDQTDSNTAGGLNRFEAETAYNPKLCEATYVEGTIDQATASALGISTSAPATLPAGALAAGPASVITSLPSLAPPNTSLGNSPGSVSSPAALSSVAADYSGTTYKTASSKDWYTDPVGITITSLAQNLTWSVDDSNGLISSESSYVVPYQFAYDGWTTNALSDTDYKNGNYTAAIELSYFQSTNTDFEEIMTFLFGPGVILVCGGVSPAVFTQDMALTGTQDGYSASNADSATGGCSDLVSWNHSDGWGTRS